MSYYKVFFIALLIGVSFAFYYIIYPFILAIIFALIFAHFFKKPYHYFRQRFNERIASIMSVVLVVGVIVIPFILFTVLLSIESRRGYVQMQKIIASGLNELELVLEKNNFYQDIKKNPDMIKMFSNMFLDEEVDDVQSLVRQITSEIKNLVAILFQSIQRLILNIGNLIFNFFIMLYMLYFFFKEGENVLQQIKNFIPMEESETQELINEAFRIIDATIIGTLIIGVMEGSFVSMLFFFLNIPSPVTWGMMVIVVSMLPVVGTNGFLIPLGFYLVIIGDYFTGLVILIVGGGGIVISQNIIRPKLVGDRSGLHPSLIVISTLGGIIALGVSGFLMGPIIATIFVVFWKLFREKIRIDNLGTNQ